MSTIKHTVRVTARCRGCNKRIVRQRTFNDDDHEDLGDAYEAAKVRLYAAEAMWAPVLWCGDCLHERITVNERIT